MTPSSEESEKDELEGPDGSDGSNSDDDEEGGAEDTLTADACTAASVLSKALICLGDIARYWE
jgi:hypothetical protein